MRSGVLIDLFLSGVFSCDLAITQQETHIHTREARPKNSQIKIAFKIDQDRKKSQFAKYLF